MLLVCSSYSYRVCFLWLGSHPVSWGAELCGTGATYTTSPKYFIQCFREIKRWGFGVGAVEQVCSCK